MRIEAISNGSSRKQRAVSNGDVKMGYAASTAAGRWEEESLEMAQKKNHLPMASNAPCTPRHLASSFLPFQAPTLPSGYILSVILCY